MSDQGYGGGYGGYGAGGDPQYPADPYQAGGYGQGYGQPPTPPPGRSNQRGLFIGLGAVLVAGLVVLVLAVTGVFSSDSTSVDGPKQVVEKVLFASKKQNLDDVKAVVCKKDLADPDLPDLVGKNHAETYSIGTVTEQSDERAAVDVTVTTSSKTSSSKLPVVKEDGKWKVCFNDETVNTTDGPTDGPTDVVPTGPTSLPTSDTPTTGPSTPASSGFCGTQATASDVAKTFISFITLSSTSLAADCVYQGRLTSAQLEALTGGIYSPTENDGKPGPQFVYKSVTGDATITLTVERESDGKYYVTAASKS